MSPLSAKKTLINVMPVKTGIQYVIVLAGFRLVPE